MALHSIQTHLLPAPLIYKKGLAAATTRGSIRSTELKITGHAHLSRQFRRKWMGILLQARNSVVCRRHFKDLVSDLVPTAPNF